MMDYSLVYMYFINLVRKDWVKQEEWKHDNEKRKG